MNPLVLLFIGMGVVLFGILVVKLHPVLALLTGALIVGLLTSPDLLQTYAVGKKMSPAQVNALLNQSLGERLADGFGQTCTKIGLLIVLASITAKCILDSGAAERIIRALLRVSGEKRAPIAFMLSSFILGIPIFVDTVFMLMLPLTRAMGVRSPKSYPLYIMGVISGAAITHSLVPPASGPLFAARALNVNLGTMMIMGLIIGVFCSTSGVLYAYWVNKRQDIPLRTTADTSIEKLKEWSQKDTSELPSFFMSLLPVLTPVVLISGETITDSMGITGSLYTFFKLTGDPVIAMFIGTVISIILLSKQFRYKVKALKKPMEEAVQSAGTIIMIIASGGAFGTMLQETSIGSWLAVHTVGFKLAILPLAFLITALIRTAQGSATVAMITAVGILTAFSTHGALSFHPVYLAIVIGCGAKVIPWMNDAGFWVIGKMSGFTERETLRNDSVLLAVMGVTGLVVTMLMAKIFPFPF